MIVHTFVDALARMDEMCLRGGVENELLRATDLRQPRMCVVRVIVQPRYGASRPEKDLGEGSVEPLVALLGCNVAWNIDWAAHRARDIVRHEVRPRKVATKNFVFHER